MIGDLLELLFLTRVDCGLPSVSGLNLSTIQEWDAIGVNRAMHVRCMEGRSQFGSERLVCQPTGQWQIKILCISGGTMSVLSILCFFYISYFCFLHGITTKCAQSEMLQPIFLVSLVKSTDKTF